MPQLISKKKYGSVKYETSYTGKVWVTTRTVGLATLFCRKHTTQKIKRLQKKSCEQVGEACTVLLQAVQRVFDVQCQQCCPR